MHFYFQLLKHINLNGWRAFLILIFRKEGDGMKKPITVEINTEFLDEAIEKANRLVELLKEAVQIIDSLSNWFYNPNVLET